MAGARLVLSKVPEGLFAFSCSKNFGLYRDRKGKEFRLGAFHDDLLKNGSLPLSIVEWLMLDDPGTLERALRD